VDAGREWLEAQAQAHPALGAALQDGSIRRAAGSVTRLWARATEQRVMELRRCEGIRKQMNYSHVHRTMTSLTRAFALQHTTMSTFLAQPLDGIQRWQSALTRHNRLGGRAHTLAPAAARRICDPGHAGHLAAAGQHLDVRCACFPPSDAAH
jgi:hypothetical protein